MTRSRWWRHGLPAAVSVLLGFVVGVVTPLATGAGRTGGWVAGLVALVALWAGWEALRAVRSAGTGPRVAGTTAGPPARRPGHGHRHPRRSRRH